MRNIRGFWKDGPKLNQLLFINDLEIFVDDEIEVDLFVQTFMIFNEYIKMEFGIR